MLSKSSHYDDCCLLINIDFNSERIRQLLENRLKCNSSRTSFDFKSLPPEQPSKNIKVSRSFLRFQPKRTFVDDYEEQTSTDSSSTSDNEEVNNDETAFTNDDDYLNKLAEWEPENFQPVLNTDNDYEHESNDEKDAPNSVHSITQEIVDIPTLVNQMDCSIEEEIPSTTTDDILVTFVHQIVKDEPISYDSAIEHPLQLDGQMDISTNESSIRSNQEIQERDLNSIVAKIKAKTCVPNRVIPIHRIPPCSNKIDLGNDKPKKSNNPKPKRLVSTNSKPDRIKEVSSKQSKPFKQQSKQIKPRLLSSLLRNNEDTIRPLTTRVLPNTNHAQPLPRTSSEKTSSLANANQEKLEKVKSLPNGEGQTSQNRPKSCLTTVRQKYNLHHQKSPEKSAAVYMKIEQKKLNHLQENKRTKPGISDPNNIPSVLKVKSKDGYKIPLKSFKSSTARPSSSANLTSTSSVSDPTKKLQKKSNKIKSFNVKELTSSSNTQTPKKVKILKSNATNNKEPIQNQNSEPEALAVVSNNITASNRSEDFFNGCITIDDDGIELIEKSKNGATDDDDDDIQEINHQQYCIAYDIRTREKLLDHAVHSSSMHVKWLFNLEQFLLEHILICRERNIRPLNSQSQHPTNSPNYYHIDPSFISIVMINFIKMFILRNSSTDQQEHSFVQFGLTSHLRYLLIELPTYNHHDDKDENDNCFKCHQYSLIVNILFDLLFDLIEHDLCEIDSKVNYRSSLIEDDYFARFLQSDVTKTNPLYRIKFVIYFIELIGVHMNKCHNRKQFQFNQTEDKLFLTIENFIQLIVSGPNSSINGKIPICFSVMELCILFANEKQSRIKQMALFLSNLCQDNFVCLKLFSFEKSLLVDIRLLLIHELISKRFELKFISVNYIEEFFRKIYDGLNASNFPDESILLLLRSLFTTYIDLMNEIKIYPLMYSGFTQHITVILRRHFDAVFKRVVEISSDNPTYFEQIKSTLIFFRLLGSRWDRL